MAITPENPNSILEPTAISGEADSAIATPVTVTPEADSGISTPVTVTPEADSGISTPNSVTPKADSAIATPVTVSSQATVNPATPSVIAPLAPAVINRALTPLFNFNAALGLPDTVTYSRSSSASYIETYRGPLGRFQKRLTNDYVGSVENLVTYSEQFDNANWIKNAVTISKSSELNSDSGTNCFALSPSNASSTHFINSQLIPVTINDITTQFFIVKFSGYQHVQLTYGSATHGNGQHANFDLVNGVVTANFGGVAHIQYLNNQWYRISFTSPVITTGDAVAIIGPVPSANSLRVQAFIGDPSKSVLIYKAQFTKNAKPLPYVRTFDSAVTETFTANPRYEEKGLLVEGASTNLILRSEEFDNAAYGQTRVLVQGNAALSPDKSFNAEKLNATATTGDHFVTQNVSATNPTISIYAKAGSLSFLQIVAIGGSTSRSYFNLSNGTIGTTLSIDNANIEDVGSGWFRCSVSVTDSITSVRFYLNESDNVSSFTGVVTDNIFIWGAQVESLPFATSYIRTEGSVVSRALDDVSASLYNQDIGSILVESALLGSSADLPDGRLNYSFHSGVATNRIISHNRNGGTGGIFAIASGSQVGVINPAVSVNQELTTTVVTYENKNLLLYASGLLVAQSVSMPLGKNFIALSIGSTLSNGSLLNGHIKRLEVYDLSLTANEVKAL